MKVLQEYRMHQETVSDSFATVLKFHFADGTKVSRGDVVIEVETSKAVLEIDADMDGVIEYRCKVGDEVHNGEVLFILYDKWENPTCSNEGHLPKTAEKQARSVIHPLFSKKALILIQKHGLNKERFKGRDVVTREDVEELVFGAPPNANVDPALKKGIPPAIEPDNKRLLDSESLVLEKLPPSKKTEITYLSKVQSAGMNSTLHIPVEVDGLLPHLNGSFAYLKDTLLPVVVYETAQLLNEYKEFNAFYVDHQIAYHQAVNIGVAVDIDDGLKVLTLPETNQMMPRQIERAIKERIDLYLERKLTPGHITGSTFTISDLSSQNLSLFQPLINKNQSAILGISGVDRKLGRSMLSFVFDHRVAAGMRAGQFLNELKERVETYRPVYGPAGSPAEKHKLPAGSAALTEQQANATCLCHRCLKTLEEDLALSGPGLIKTILADGKEAVLCRDCLMGF